MEEIQDSSTFMAWKRMIRVCYVPTEKGYSEIGGKGIGVYKPWRDSFTKFKRDLGASEGRRLQRKDKSEGFNPGNVYWGQRNQW